MFLSICLAIAATLAISSWGWVLFMGVVVIFPGIFTCMISNVYIRSYLNFFLARLCADFSGLIIGFLILRSGDIEHVWWGLMTNLVLRVIMSRKPKYHIIEENGMAYPINRKCIDIFSLILSCVVFTVLVSAELI